jgi:hypothetical protein
MSAGLAAITPEFEAAIAARCASPVFRVEGSAIRTSAGDTPWRAAAISREPAPTWPLGSWPFDQDRDFPGLLITCPHLHYTMRRLRRDFINLPLVAERDCRSQSSGSNEIDAGSIITDGGPPCSGTIRSTSGAALRPSITDRIAEARSKFISRWWRRISALIGGSAASLSAIRREPRGQCTRRISPVPARGIQRSAVGFKLGFAGRVIVHLRFRRRIGRATLRPWRCLWIVAVVATRRCNWLLVGAWLDWDSP